MTTGDAVHNNLYAGAGIGHVRRGSVKMVYALMGIMSILAVMSYLPDCSAQEARVKILTAAGPGILSEDSGKVFSVKRENQATFIPRSEIMYLVMRPRYWSPWGCGDEILDSLGAGGKYARVGIEATCIPFIHCKGMSDDYSFDPGPPDGGPELPPGQSNMMNPVLNYASEYGVPIGYCFNATQWSYPFDIPSWSLPYHLLNRQLSSEKISGYYNGMWNQHNEYPIIGGDPSNDPPSILRYWTLSFRDCDDPDAPRYKHYWERNHRQALSILSQFNKNHPDLLIDISGENEVSFPTPNDKDEYDVPQFGDYNPLSIQDFREYEQLRFGDIGGFNQAFNTEFATWEDIDPPRYYPDDPRPLPFMQNPGPRGDWDWLSEGNAYFLEWTEFKIQQVKEFEQKFADIALEEGIPPDKLFSHQIGRINNLYGDFYNLCSPLSTADLMGASLGITHYGSPTWSGDLYSQCFDLNANWGIFEFNPHCSNNYWNNYNELHRIFTEGCHIVVFNEWDPQPSTIHTIKGTEFERAIGDFHADYEAVPRLGNGYFIAAGDFNGTGTDDIVVAPGEGMKYPPILEIIRLNGAATSTSFYAYQKELRRGVCVAAADLDGNGLHEIITAPASIALSSYTLSKDYGSTQGHRQWYYQRYENGVYNDLVWTGTYWQRSSSGWSPPAIWFDGAAHPSGIAESAIKWIAPISGVVRVMGAARKLDTGGGNGVIVSIDQNGESLWDSPIAYNDAIGVQFVLADVTVNEGDALHFRINSIGGDEYYDLTSFEPTITYTSLGTSIGPLVKVFSGTGTYLSSFNAYESNYEGGVSLAAGDVDLISNREEIVAGPGAFHSPEVRVFQMNGTLLHNFEAYPVSYLDGVRVAVGDLDGDGTSEIITAPGPSHEPWVKAFHADGAPYEWAPGIPVEFVAYDNYYGEISITAADIDGDGKDEIITGAGTKTGSGDSYGPRVRAFKASGEQILDFSAYAGEFEGGVVVSAAKIRPTAMGSDLDGDGLFDGEEILLGTDALAVDSDKDGLSDYDEVRIYLVDPLNPDTDNDGVNDGDEIIHGTNPLLPDTDDDGISDFIELMCGGNPLDGLPPVRISISFQPLSTSPPVGYAPADSQVFDSRGYGWR